MLASKYNIQWTIWLFPCIQLPQSAYSWSKSKPETLHSWKPKVAKPFLMVRVFRISSGVMPLIMSETIWQVWSSSLWFWGSSQPVQTNKEKWACIFLETQNKLDHKQLHQQQRIGYCIIHELEQNILKREKRSYKWEPTEKNKSDTTREAHRFTWTFNYMRKRDIFLQT